MLVLLRFIVCGIGNSVFEHTSELKPVIGSFEPQQFDEVSNRILPTSQRSCNTGSSQCALNMCNSSQSIPQAAEQLRPRYHVKSHLKSHERRRVFCIEVCVCPVYVRWALPAAYSTPDSMVGDMSAAMSRADAVTLSTPEELFVILVCRLVCFVFVFIEFSHHVLSLSTPEDVRGHGIPGGDVYSFRSRSLLTACGAAIVVFLPLAVRKSKPVSLAA